MKDGFRCGNPHSSYPCRNDCLQDDGGRGDKEGEETEEIDEEGSSYDGGGERCCAYVL